MRTRYLGPLWELAKVRGTRFNTGDGIRMALEIGAMPTGNWSGGHAVGWDRNASEFGDLSVGDNFQKHSYPLGIMINANGERFVDEGADLISQTSEGGRRSVATYQKICQPSESTKELIMTNYVGLDVAKGLRIRSAADWRQRCFCPHLCGRESRPQRSQ